jgi:general secretion pathway protein D
MKRSTARAALCLSLALTGSGAAAQSPQPSSPPSPPQAVVTPNVRATVVPGAPQPAAPAAPAVRPGDVQLNYPNVEVRDAARAVLGDVLGLTYAVAPGVSGRVSVVTGEPIARADVLLVFEEALRGADLALVNRAGVLTITSVEQAQGANVGGGELGFGSETVQLRFISAAELKKILDSVVPGAATTPDPASNTLVISGTTGQRRAVQNLVREFDVDWLQGSSFALYIPQNTDARLIAPELERLLNSPGAPTAGLVRLVSMERLNGILAIAREPQLLESTRRWVEILDREGQSTERRLYVYRVQNGRSSDLARVLIQAFGGTPPATEPTVRTPLTTETESAGSATEGTAATAARPDNFGVFPSVPTAQAQAGTSGLALGQAIITSDDTNNALLAYATPREYAVIEDALRKLDVTPVQVLIEAAITEVRLNDDLRYGVQWRFLNNGNDIALSEGNTANPVRQFPGFSFFYGNGSTITATLNALSSLTKVNVLSSPKLLVLNNHTASLQIGDQVPVATQSAVSVTDPDAPIVNSIEYRDTGVILKVTPRVNAGGLVLLDVAQEVSDVAQTSTSDLNSPTISQRRISSSIAVQDGQTIALGGLIRASRVNGRSGVPILSAIPVLGGLFGDRVVDGERTELLILLTPRVVRSAEQVRTVTDELRDKIRALEPRRPNPALLP